MLMSLPKQDAIIQQASSCLPNEALVGVSQVGPHGIALNAGDAIVGRLARYVDSAGAIRLKPSAGHYQPFTRQHAGQSPIAAAVAGAVVRLLHTHKEQTSATNASGKELQPVGRFHCCRSIHRPRENTT